jgi:hypothetical protein
MPLLGLQQFTGLLQRHSGSTSQEDTSQPLRYGPGRKTIVPLNQTQLANEGCKESARLAQEDDFVIRRTDYATPGLTIPSNNRRHDDTVDEFGVHLRPFELSDTEDEKDNFDHFSMTPLQVASLHNQVGA